MTYQYRPITGLFGKSLCTKNKVVFIEHTLIQVMLKMPSPDLTFVCKRFCESEICFQDMESNLFNVCHYFQQKIFSAQ